MIKRNANDQAGRQRLVQEVGDRAEGYYKQGLCCSEALFRAAAETLTDDNGQAQGLTAMASGLCGGMGNKQATCGVFTGGAVAVGFLVGRDSTQDKAKTTRALAAQFQETLQKEAGGHVCEELLKKFGPVRNLNKRMCRKLTRQGAELLARTVLENGLPGAGASGKQGRERQVGASGK